VRGALQATAAQAVRRESTYFISQIPRLFAHIRLTLSFISGGCAAEKETDAFDQKGTGRGGPG
jgi:hypothetical protein